MAARALFRSWVRHFDAAEPGDLNRRRSTAVNRSRSNNGSKSNTCIPQQADLLSDAYDFADHSHKEQDKISVTFSAQRPLLTKLPGRALDTTFEGAGYEANEHLVQEGIVLEVRLEPLSQEAP